VKKTNAVVRPGANSEKVRDLSIPVPVPAKNERGSHAEGTKSGAGDHAGRRVYRVGGFRIPVKNSLRGPKSRCAGRVKDLLRRRADVPVGRHVDPTEFEPPIRKPPVSGERSISRFFGPSPGAARSGQGRFEAEDDVEDPDWDRDD
jgi:hypothetical protein